MKSNKPYRLQFILVNTLSALYAVKIDLCWGMVPCNDVET